MWVAFNGCRECWEGVGDVFYVCVLLSSLFVIVGDLLLSYIFMNLV